MGTAPTCHPLSQYRALPTVCRGQYRHAGTKRRDFAYRVPRSIQRVLLSVPDIAYRVPTLSSDIA
eukprot:3006540-Rhodomonas_salina.5